MVKGDVFVNERRINTQKQTLYHGDVLSFGKCKVFLFIIHVQATRNSNLLTHVTKTYRIVLMKGSR